MSQTLTPINAEMDFSFDSLKTCPIDEESVRKCFQHFCQTSDGLTFDSFNHLLEALLVNSEGVSYELSLQWKKDWFRQFDLNGDQIIDWQEFQLMWTNWIETIISPKSALLVIDVQNDFITGSLAIKGAEDVIPIINGLIENVAFDKVVYSQDWHPSDHISFFDNRAIRRFNSNSPEDEVKLYDTVIFEGCPQMEQKLWPIHCVQQTSGSSLHSDLVVKNNSIRVFKGIDSDVDSYSAFRDNQRLRETDLNQQLQSQGITDLFICGLAIDFCVGSSAMDAIDYGYRTVLIEDASRGICAEAIDRIKCQVIDNKGVVVNSSQVVNMVEAIDRRPELAFVSALKPNIKTNV